MQAKDVAKAYQSGAVFLMDECDSATLQPRKTDWPFLACFAAIAFMALAPFAVVQYREAQAAKPAVKMHCTPVLDSIAPSLFTSL